MKETRMYYIDGKMVDLAYTWEDVMKFVDEGDLEQAYDTLLLGGVVNYIGRSGHGDEDEYYSLLSEVEHMRNKIITINDMDFEVWFKRKEDKKARRMCAFHFLFDAEEYIENQHESIKDCYYIKDLNDRRAFYNECF